MMVLTMILRIASAKIGLTSWDFLMKEIDQMVVLLIQMIAIVLTNHLWPMIGDNQPTLFLFA